MFDDGGLMDEGGTVDPVSGNDVPPGSTQEEVRDDIPAQLSEGEFVMPADVVRYFGLEKLMEMRQEAKMGLQRMEDMGQMGNSEEAIMPDNLPFDIDDIDMEDDNEPQEFNLGGVVQQPGTGIAGYTPPPMPTTGYTPPPVGVAVSPVVPGSQPQVAFTPATASTNIPNFGQFVGTSGGAYDELVTYVNDAGAIRQIPHINGKPIYPVPEGFKKQEKPTDTAPESPLVEKTAQQPQGDDGGGNDASGISTGTGSAKVGSISEAMSSLFGSKNDKPAEINTLDISQIYNSAAQTNDYFGGSKAFGWTNEELRGATFTQAGTTFASIGLVGMLSNLNKEFGDDNFNLNDIGTAGFTAMNNSLNSMGLINRGQLANNAQATLVGQAMTAAHQATSNNKNAKAAYDKVMNTPEARVTIDKSLDDIRRAYSNTVSARGGGTEKQESLTFAQAAEVARANAKVFKSEVNDLANPVNGSARITTADGTPINTVIDRNTGKRVQDQTKSRAFTGAGQRKVNEAEAKQKIAENHAEILDSRANRAAQAAQAAKVRDDIDSDYEDSDSDNNNDSPSDNNNQSGPNDAGGYDDYGGNEPGQATDE